MKKTAIILSLFALNLSSYGQTTNVQTIENALSLSESSFAMDTAADGTIVIEITQSPHLKTREPPPHDISRPMTDYHKAGALIYAIGVFIYLPLHLTIWFLKKKRKNKPQCKPH